ncbi:MAG: tRNA (adenosine(37)-N6)-threonylcarbamoyltransferase complex dimerization subunit type 1 TsaB [Pirellulales bacterium]|nr:tRNA (adenosine(37)-N6)-threonylcarbamoyltransferase complex dimerization subunit type 1 TsaB [Pirellulales bacterium]
MGTLRRILALETSARHGSVALLHGEAGPARLVAELALVGDERSAQALLPAVRKLLDQSAWPAGTIDIVAVAVGPGSFTGLRIGVTAAKTFAYAVGADLVGVNTLVALALQTPRAEGPLWTVMDAQRQELFAAKFESTIADCTSCVPSLPRFAVETRILAQDRWLAELQAGDWGTGPALHRLAPRVPTGVCIVPCEHWQPMAAAVGQVAWHMHEAGHRDSPWQLVPQYYRSSAAEEKLERRG